MMSNTSNLTTDDPDCRPFDSNRYIAVTLLSASTGAVSAAASLLVAVGILASKKRLFFIQRLVLYLSVAVFLNSLSVVLRLQRVAALGGGSVKHIHPLCVFTAFLDQTTSWSALIAICCITCSLLLNILLLRSFESLEKVYVALIFAVPLSFNWIPFIKESYGEAGAWCWIRKKNEDCSEFPFGTYLRFVLWYVPLYVVLVILFVTYIFIVYRVRKLSKKFDGKFDPANRAKREKMLKEFRPLIWYPLIYMIMRIFPTINRIHGAFSSEPALPLWILHAFFSPLSGGFIALAYALDGQTLRRLWDCSTVCAVFRRRGKNRVTEYPSAQGRSDSFSKKRPPQTNQSSSGDVGDRENDGLANSEKETIALTVLGSTSNGADTLAGCTVVQSVTTF